MENAGIVKCPFVPLFCFFGYFEKKQKKNRVLNFDWWGEKTAIYLLNPMRWPFDKLVIDRKWKMRLLDKKIFLIIVNIKVNG